LITALIQEHGLTRFFTLTLDRERVEGDPWDYVHRPWSKLRKRLRRRFPGTVGRRPDASFNYVAVLEAHKNTAYPHVHGFTNVWLHQRDWSSLWASCGGGPVVWVEKVEDPQLSEYVSKQIEVARYVGKENLRIAYKEKKRHRTLWRSEGLKAKYELTPEPGWCIIKEHVFTDEGELTPFWKNKELYSCPSVTSQVRPGENMQRLTCVEH